MEKTKSSRRKVGREAPEISYDALESGALAIKKHSKAVSTQRQYARCILRIENEVWPAVRTSIR